MLLFVKFVSTRKHWHGLLSSLDKIRIISACLTPNLMPGRLKKW